jgi:hypothetical protein
MFPTMLELSNMFPSPSSVKLPLSVVKTNVLGFM